MSSRRAVCTALMIAALGVCASGGVAATAREDTVEIDKLHVPGQTTVTLTAVADATLKAYVPDTNFGDDDYLQILYDDYDGEWQVAMLRFDLGPLPYDAVIDSAHMRLFLAGASGTSSVSIAARRVTSSWNESTVVWNTNPKTEVCGDPHNAFCASFADIDDVAGAYKSWDVRAFVESWLDNPKSNRGVLLLGPDSGASYERAFESRDHNERVPSLVVAYHLAPYTFSGHVYRGKPTYTGLPLSDVTVELWGDDDEWPEAGYDRVRLASTTTSSGGSFQIDWQPQDEWAFLHVIEVDPPGALSTGARVDEPGYVRNFNVVSYRVEDLYETGSTAFGPIDFWDVPETTVTPTPSRTPTDTPTPRPPEPERLPDLVIADAEWTMEEDGLRVYVRVENQGEGRSGSSDVYAEVVPSQEGDTIRLPRLGPGRSDEVVLTLPFPPELHHDPFEVFVHVDPGQRVEESDEGNNERWLEGEPVAVETPEEPTDTPRSGDGRGEVEDGGDGGLVILIVVAVGIAGLTLGGLIYGLVRLFGGGPGPAPEPGPEPQPEPEPEPEPEEPHVPVIPFPPVRLLRIWLSQGATGEGEVLHQRDLLQAGSLYTLHLQVQPRGDKDRQPSDGAGGGEAERLRVALYAPDSDFGFVPEPVFMSLPEQGAGSEVCYPVRARRAGLLKLRACIYYGNVLLQTALLEAVAVDGEGRGPAKTAISRVTDYVASMDPRDLRALPQPRLNIFTNRGTDGSHWVGLFAGSRNAPEAFRTGMLHTFGAGELASAAGELRSLLADIQGRGAYRFAASAADPPRGVEHLERHLVRLASRGHSLYNALFFSKLDAEERADALLSFQELLREPGIISVARCRADATTIPWAALYDLYLDANAPLKLCRVFKEQLLAGEDLLERPSACRAQSACPLGQGDGGTVCPLGFWGFLHLMEQPLQQVTPTTVDEIPPQLASEAYEQSCIIERAPGGQAELAVAYYPRLPRVEDHLNELEAVARSGGMQVRTEDERERIVKDMLRQGGSHLYYFYCHGEVQGNLMQLKLGPADRPGYLAAADLDPRWRLNWRGKPHSLVILNACETVAVVPERMGELMLQFRFLGSGGVVGTEIPVRTELASEVGTSLVREIVRGSCVGEAFLAVRRDLLRQYNPLGLAYTCHAPATLHLHTPEDCAWCRTRLRGRSAR